MRRSTYLGIAAALLGTAIFLPSANAQQTVEAEVLIASRSDWSYLLYSTAAFVPVDPVTVDPDFHTTWQRSAGYNGPAFLTGAAPLGYEVVTGDPLVTDVWAARDGNSQPPSGQRYSVYFRKSFTPTAAVRKVRISGITDDGAIIYLNGTRLTDTGNFAAGAADAWNLLTNAVGSETVAFTTDVDAVLPAGVPAELAVSLHNTSATSSDLGMNFRVVALEELEPTPPPNDNFADALAIDNTTGLPASIAERANDGLTPRGPAATLEAGEPAFPGATSQGSVWFSYTPTESGPLQMSAAASSLNSLIAVYTGNALNSLSLVAAAADDVKFYGRATVFFNGVANQTYFISVGIEDVGNAPLVDSEDFGTARITVSVPKPSIFTEIATLLPAGSDWLYLLATQDDPINPATMPNRPIDPSTIDPDFHTTWQRAAGYNGPPFSGPAPALLGYGLIDADPIITDIWGARDTDGDPLTVNLVPPTGLRYTSYFRTTFTPTTAVAHLGFRGIVDDGAEIFINGVRKAQINYFGAENSWRGVAATAADTETGPQEAVALSVNLPANAPVQIAVAVHNNTPQSSDMGFDLEVFSIPAPNLDFGKLLDGNDPLVASFESSPAAAMSGLGNSPGDSLPWTSTSGAVQAESGLGNPPTPAGKALYINNGRIDFVSGAVDLFGVDNGEVVATVDFRTFDTSTGFEAGDTMLAYIEVSLDGVNFVRIADVLPVLTGGDPDNLKVLELGDGAYTTYRSTAGAIPVTAEAMRVVIAGVNNSDNEHFFIDNVRIGTDLGPPPAFTATISRNQITRQNTIRWDGDGSSLYTLYYSPSDLAGWTPILTDSALTSFNHTPPAGVAEAFYYVERFAD